MLLSAQDVFSPATSLKTAYRWPFHLPCLHLAVLELAAGPIWSRGVASGSLDEGTEVINDLSHHPERRHH